MLDAIDVRGLLALLLADGSLINYRTPAGGYVQLTLTAGIQESSFLEEKVAEFRQFIPTRAQIIHYRSSRRANGKTTPCLRFRVSTTKLRPIYNLLYPAGERRITATALGILGAQAAAWLWAEGCRSIRDGGAELARVGASAEEAELIGRWLEMLTGAESTLCLSREKIHRRPRLLFDPAQASKIRAALAPYAPQTRQHLFRDEYWDVSTIRSARTELLLGEGDPASCGAEEAPVAGIAPL